MDEKTFERIKAENLELRHCVEQIKCELQNSNAQLANKCAELDKLQETLNRCKQDLEAARFSIKILEAQIEAYKFCASRGR